MDMCEIERKLTKKEHMLSPELIPNASEELFMAIADNGNHFLDFGIREGTGLIFNRQKPFKPGYPACFLNERTQTIKLLREMEKGYIFMGRLVATINYIE